MAEDYTNARSIKYGGKLIDVTNDYTLLAKKIPFSKQETRIGSSFQVPVQLTRSGNFTPGGKAPAALSTVDTTSVKYEFATAVSNEIVLSTRVNFGDITRNEGGEVVFIRTAERVPEQMAASAGVRSDYDMIYGRSPLTTTVSPQTSTVSTQFITFTINAADSSPGLFYASEEQLVDFFANDAAVAPIVASGACKISSFDDSTTNPTLVVDAGSGANATALKTAIDAASVQMYFYRTRVGAVAAGDASFNQMVGIFSSLSQTSGSVFGIPVTYSGWRGRRNPLSVAAPLSFQLINNAAARLAAIGLKKDLVALVSHKGWEQAMNDQAALRMYDSSYSSKGLDQGAEKLTFHSINGGKIEVLPHPCVKNSHAFILDLDAWTRVGSTEWTFSLPALGNIVNMIPGTTQIEMLAYADFCIAPKRLSNNVLITNLTP